MNWIQKLFCPQQPKVEQVHKIDVIIEKSETELYEQNFINQVIIKLKEEPESFSALWFGGNKLEPSVEHYKKRILIMRSTGQIISPIEPTMSNEQKETIKSLLEPIVLRDMKKILADSLD
jgi:hypothetical protein